MTTGALPLGGDAARGGKARERRAERTSDARLRWRMEPEARGIVLITAVLLAFGLAVLYSASALVAMNESKGSAFYLFRQLSGAAAGIVAFAVAAKLDADRWRQWAWPLMGFTLLTLFLVLVLPDSIAPTINGSKRFLLGASFQPSEFGKLAVVAWTAMLAVKKGPEGLRRLSKGLLPFLVVIGIAAVLCALEPDLSVAMLYFLLMGIVLYSAGARIGHFVFLGIVAIPIVWNEVERVGYALARLVSFFDAEKAQTAISYQLEQSLVAVGSGGFSGKGFGKGIQQYGFLPYPYSDFIGSNIGEEWGFLGLTVVILLFAGYGYLGFRIAQRARSEFLKLLAVGLTFTTVLTAFLHIGVVIGLLPTTGLTLPFISYGRSNLVLSLFFTGILVNIGSTRERVVARAASDPLSV